MKAGELFAGYGGLALAVEAVFGAQTAWVAEWDEAPSKILAHHWPKTPNHRDVTTVDWANIEQVQIISGGSPCQDISAAGARRGMTEGTRSNLWVAMREAIAIQQPDLVVWENVKGAFSAKATSGMEPCPGCMGDTSDRKPHLRALGRVLGDLSTLGYDAQWRTIRVTDIGGPHQRARIFILAWRRGAYTLSQRRIQGGEGPLQSARFGYHPQRLRNRYSNGPESDPCGTTPLISLMPPQPNPPTRKEASYDFGEYTPAIKRWEAVLGREAPPAATPSSTGKPQLNPRFSEWLMGLPDGWVTSPEIGLTRAQQLKALGNGVVPQQASVALADMWGNLAPKPPHQKDKNKA